MKKTYVFLTILFTILTSIYTYASSGSNDTVWMAGDEAFNTITNSSLSSEQTLDGLTVGKGVCKLSSIKMFKGDKLEKYFCLPNFGNTEKGFIKFDVSGQVDIYIIGCTNSNGEARNLKIYSTSTKEESSITINEPSGYKFQYRGGAGSIYLYTEAMPIRIYGVGFKKSNYIDNTYSSVGKGFQDALNNFSVNTPINSTQIVGDFAFFANETNTMNVKSNGIKDDSYIKYRNVLKMGGSGYNNRYRCVGVYPEHNCDIYITARSANHGADRKIMITNKFYETICDEVIVTPEPITYKIEYKGYDDCLFIKSLDGGIDIYDIKLLSREYNNSNDTVWNFGINDNFKNQSFTDNKQIDSLGIYPNINTVTIADSKFMNYNKVLKLPALDSYNRSSRLDFIVPDSSGKEGKTAPRKIVITVSAPNNNVKLMLINAAGYVYGAKQMDPSQSTYYFDYDGTGERLTLYGIATKGDDVVNIYRIATNDNLEMVNTGSKTITVKNGVTYPLYLTAEKIKNTNDYEYEVKYDAKLLSVESVGITDGTYNYGDNGINIIFNKNGILRFNVSRKDEYWSGLFTVVKFKAIADGSTTLQFTANYNK